MIDLITKKNHEKYFCLVRSFVTFLKMLYTKEYYFKNVTKFGSWSYLTLELKCRQQYKPFKNGFEGARTGFFLI